MRKTSFSAKCCVDLGVQLARRREVVAERLLDDQPHPALGAAALADLAARASRSRSAGRRSSRRGCPASRAPCRARSASSASLSSAAFVGEVERRVVHPRGELVPDVLVERVARVLLDGLLHPLAEARRRSPRVRAAPTIANFSRQQLPDRRARRAPASASSRVRSPDAPKMTRMHGSGRRRRRSPSSSGFASSACAVTRADPALRLRLRDRLDRVAAELVAQRRVDLGGERLVLPRGEAREERRA